MVDPKAFSENSFVDVSGETWSSRRILSRSPVPSNTSNSGERFNYMFGKSTYARCGIIVNVTPLEPEWEGHVTLEFSNTTTLPAKIYANEGVAQMLFFESDERCEITYKDRNGKYQGQTGVTLPKP